MGRFLFSLILALASTVIHVESLTKFHIGGQLICALDKKFIYVITLFEWDTLFDDNISPLTTGRGHWTGNFHFEGQDNWDGLWDNFFELYMGITHNCNKGGVLPYRTYRFHMGDFLINDGEYTRSYSINITNAGFEDKLVFGNISHG
ncbi:hypothetical protein B9Z55_023103 [Caenorhabditis nigoni]|uniref:Uncharacterized protein n=1 Tax=Caenorhabditis nigoni TaxID=1611254 RepID=A0A2G5SN15_9PELO|nr:hypothetical protein B9Z55_023103 [Caenorhabditis nigoni]